MKTGNDTNSMLAVYLDNLTIQLRLRDVRGDRIGQILAEVETHVADTGLDPVDAFGEPGEYAASASRASRGRPALRLCSVQAAPRVDLRRENRPELSKPA